MDKKKKLNQAELNKLIKHMKDTEEERKRYKQEYQKHYREEHKEQLKKMQKKYDHNRKKEVCECGGSFSYYSRLQHMTTNRHKLYEIKKKSEVITTNEFTPIIES